MMKHLITLAIVGGLTFGLIYVWVGETETACQICQRPLHTVTMYRIQLSADEKVDVCCPRCGLHFQNARPDVEASEVADFESGVLFPAEEAIYVVGSEVHLCCSSERVREDRTGMQYVLSWDRCLPSVVAFRDKASARLFQTEKGGYLSTYDQLVEQESPRNLSSKP